MKGFLKKIGSLRITIAVVLLIAGASLYGTLLRQEEAMDTVYRSAWFIALLAVFGANLLACTVLRLRLRLAQAGFLATHLGVLTILAGAIVGFLSGEQGFLNLVDGEAQDRYYVRLKVNPQENIKMLESAAQSAGGRISGTHEREITAKVPIDNLRKFIHSLGKTLAYEIRDTVTVRFRPGENAAKLEEAVSAAEGYISSSEKAEVTAEIPREKVAALVSLLEGMMSCEAVPEDKDMVTVRFWPGVEIVKKPLPFTLRLDRFTIDYHNYGRLIITDKEDNIISTLPAAGGETAAVRGYKVEVGEFFPNFVYDIETRTAETRNQVPDNPAIQVALIRGAEAGTAAGESLWIFANYDGMYERMRFEKEPLGLGLYFRYGPRPKSYVSEVTILDKSNREMKKASIEVNHPLTHQRYTIYQSNYDPKRPGWTGLQVVRDPGLWVVYAGFALLLAGVFFIFYVKPYLRRRKKSAPASAAEKPVEAATS